jgi:hypothetical protein
MDETSGVLKPAIVAYLNHEAMTDAQVAAMRAYLRQWIMADVWIDVEPLRAKIDSLTSRRAIKSWLDQAAEINIDPL